MGGESDLFVGHGKSLKFLEQNLVIGVLCDFYCVS